MFVLSFDLVYSASAQDNRGPPANTSEVLAVLTNVSKEYPGTGSNQNALLDPTLTNMVTIVATAWPPP